MQLIFRKKKVDLKSITVSSEGPAPIHIFIPIADLHAAELSESDDDDFRLHLSDSDEEPSVRVKQGTDSSEKGLVTVIPENTSALPKVLILFFSKKKIRLTHPLSLEVI